MEDMPCAPRLLWDVVRGAADAWLHQRLPAGPDSALRGGEPMANATRAADGSSRIGMSTAVIGLLALAWAVAIPIALGILRLRDGAAPVRNGYIVFSPFVALLLVAFFTLPFFLVWGVLRVVRGERRTSAGLVPTVAWLVVGLARPVGGFLLCLGVLLTVVEAASTSGRSDTTSLMVILAIGLGSTLAGGMLLVVGRQRRLGDA
jgi:hypothetical protein